MGTLAVVCAAAVLVVAASVPVDIPDGAAVDSSASGGDPGAKNDTCFLNKFRTFTPEQAKKQGISYRQGLGTEMSFGSVAFDTALIIVGGGLCFVGYKLVEVMFLVAGFGSGMFLTFWITSSLMTHAPALYNCYALGIAPVVGGLIGAGILRKIEKLTFFGLGAIIGGCVGYYLYILFINNLQQTHKLNPDLCEYGTIILPALLCGCFAVKIEKKILAVSTAIIGGLALSVGIDLLILVKIDERFAAWIHPCMFKVEHACTSDYKHVEIMSGYVLGPMLGCVVISILGLVVQLKLQAKKKEKEEGFQPIPHGGYAGIQGTGNPGSWGN